jgi:hypothetical protein
VKDKLLLSFQKVILELCRGPDSMASSQSNHQGKVRCEGYNSHCRSRKSPLNSLEVPIAQRRDRVIIRGKCAVKYLIPPVISKITYQI